MNFTALAALHDFNEYLYGDKADEKKDALHVSLLSKMQKYRPSGVSFGKKLFPHELQLNGNFSLQTIFELNTHQNSAQCEVMKNKRKVHGGLIQNFQEKALENASFQSGIAESTENVGEFCHSAGSFTELHLLLSVDAAEIR